MAEVIRVSWAPAAVERAVEALTAIVQAQGDAGSDVHLINGKPLTFQAMCCLVDIGRHVLAEQATSDALQDAENERLAVEKILDQALGERAEDGAGEGLAADVALLAQQRDRLREDLRAYQLLADKRFKERKELRAELASLREAAARALHLALSCCDTYTGECDDKQVNEFMLREGIAQPPCAPAPTATTTTTTPPGATPATTTSAGTPSTATTGSPTASATHPSHRTDAPRVWQKGDPEPADVRQVRDSQDDVWTRNHGGAWESPNTIPCTWEYLAKKWGPLTEVTADQASAIPDSVGQAGN